MSQARASSLLDPALLERVKGLALVARRVVEGVLQGMHHSPLHGLSVEFSEHRQYSPGDELKRLDWRVLARSDRYVVKQYEQETNMRVVLVVDCSRSMAYGGRTAGSGADAGDGRQRQDRQETGGLADVQDADSRGKFHYARVMAAALSYLLLRQGDSVGLMLTNYRVVEQVAPRAAPGHIMSLCRVLESATPSGITDVAAVVSQLAVRLRRRSLVVVISDLLDGVDDVLAGLGRLSHRGHEVLAFQVLDPRELSFDLGLAGHGVTVIRDMETGELFEAEPQLVRDLVRDEVQRFCERLDAGARAHGVHLLRCRTDQPVGQVLTRYLHWRLRGKRL